MPKHVRHTGGKLDDRYLDAMEQEQTQAADDSWSRNVESLIDEPDDVAFERIRDDLLPDAVVRRVRSAKSIGFTDLVSSPQLIPYYDLQFVLVCGDCSRNPEVAERQAAWLEPMVEAGLVIPMLPPDIRTIHPRLLAAALKAPWVLYRLIGQLGSARQWTRTGSRPCASCQRPDCELFKRFKSLMDGVGLDDEVAYDTLAALGSDTDEVFCARLAALEQLEEDDLFEFVLSASALGGSVDDVYQADALGARSCMAMARLDSAILGFSQGTALPLGHDLLSRGATDVSARLSASEHIGVAYDPSMKPTGYVEAVAAHAGALSGVFLDDGSPDSAALSSMSDTAAAINDSVARMNRMKARLATVATALSNPIAKAALVGAATMKISPLLAACGAGGIMIQDALRGASDLKEPILAPALSAAALKVLEGVGVYAPGTYAVHDLRLRLHR